MVEEPELEVLTYRLDTLVVVMGKEHPYRPDHPVKFAEFAKLDMVGLQSGSSLQAFLEVCAGEQGLTLKTRVLSDKTSLRRAGCFVASPYDKTLPIQVL